MVFSSSVENGNDLSLDRDVAVRVSIDPSGKVRWVPGITLGTSCSVDLTYFPFDTQVSI